MSIFKNPGFGVASGRRGWPLVYQYLSTNGDGTGDTNANGDYSSTPGVFYVQPPAGEIWHIYRMLIKLQDTAGFRAERYGNLTGALTNGVEIEYRDSADAVITQIDGNAPVTNNAEWAAKCYDADLKTWGAGDEFLVVRWTFERSGGMLMLDGDAEEKLAVILNDDLTGLVSHFFFVQGRKIKVG